MWGLISRVWECWESCSWDAYAGLGDDDWCYVTERCLEGAESIERDHDCP